MARGKGCSWSRVGSTGCDVRFYGWTTELEHMAAWRTANALRDEVWAVERATEVTIVDSNDPKVGLRVKVRLTGDMLACFENGPMHRAAVSRVNHIAGNAMRGGPWENVRLSGHS